MKRLIIQMDLTFKGSNVTRLNIMVTPKSLFLRLFSLNFIYLEIKYNGTK